MIPSKTLKQESFPLKFEDELARTLLVSFCHVQVMQVMELSLWLRLALVVNGQAKRQPVEICTYLKIRTTEWMRQRYERHSIAQRLLHVEPNLCGKIDCTTHWVAVLYDGNKEAYTVIGSRHCLPPKISYHVGSKKDLSCVGVCVNAMTM